MVKKSNIALKRKYGTLDEKKVGKREKRKARKKLVVKERLDDLQEEKRLAEELADFNYF